MFVKWYEIETLKGMVKVQGLGEKFVAESLNNSNIEWSRPKAIKTPYGNYTPDFWCERAGVYIEVKGMRTALKMVGLLSLLENGKKEWAKTIDEISLEKMKWVHENVAQIDIFINDNTNDEKYETFRKDLENKISGFHLIYSKKDFLLYLESKCFK